MSQVRKSAILNILGLNNITSKKNLKRNKNRVSFHRNVSNLLQTEGNVKRTSIYNTEQIVEQKKKKKDFVALSSERKLQTTLLHNDISSSILKGNDINYNGKGVEVDVSGKDRTGEICSDASEMQKNTHQVVEDGVNQTQKESYPLYPGTKSNKGIAYIDKDDKMMPLFCNYCSVRKVCPNGKILHKDSVNLVLCNRRMDFRKIIMESGTRDREGVLKFIHRIRELMSWRAGKMLFSENVSGEIDRHLTSIMEKLSEQAINEYRMLTPRDRNLNIYNTQVVNQNKAVEEFNSLSDDVKKGLVEDLKKRLSAIKQGANRMKEVIEEVRT